VSTSPARESAQITTREHLHKQRLALSYDDYRNMKSDKCKWLCWDCHVANLVRQGFPAPRKGSPQRLDEFEAAFGRPLLKGDDIFWVAPGEYVDEAGRIGYAYNRDNPMDRIVQLSPAALAEFDEQFTAVKYDA